MGALPQDVVAFIPNLRRYARSLTRDPARGDDLVQDTLVKALSRAHLFESGTNLRSWLFTIQYHLFISGVRQSKCRPDCADFEDATALFSDPCDRIYIRQMEAVLNVLPPEQRAVLTLRALEGLGYQEIAEVIGVPVGTVRSRLSRARDRLRKELGEAGSPPVPKLDAGSPVHAVAG